MPTTIPRWSRGPGAAPITALAALILPLAAPAAVLEVAPDGSADYTTIGAALADAVAGDTVALAAGRYAPDTNGEVFPLELPPGVTLEGAGAADTVIDGAYSEGLLTVSWTEGDAVGVRGLTLTGGESPLDGFGDVLYAWQAEVHIEDTLVEANGDPSLPDMPWNLDAWVDVRTSTLSLTRVTLADNHGSHTGLRCDHEGGIDLTEVVLRDNYSYYALLSLEEQCGGTWTAVQLLDNAGSNCSGALLDAPLATAANLVAAGNDVGPCRLLVADTVVHATVVDNRSHGALPLLEVGTLGHSVVAFNDGGVWVDPVAGRALHNDVFGNTPVDWVTLKAPAADPNLSVDPRLMDPFAAAGPRDLRLADDSPLIDAGGAELSWPIDLDGTERPIDGDGDGTATPDPGAFEHPTLPEPVGDDDDGGTCAVGGASQPMEWVGIVGLGIVLGVWRRVRAGIGVGEASSVGRFS